MTDNNYKFDSTGLAGAGEKRQGSSLFNSYIDKYHIQNVSDLHLLNELVFREIIQIRTKKNLEKYKKSVTTEDNPIISSSTMRLLDDNLAKIIELKKELGLLQEKAGNDAFQYITELKSKFAKWREENQGSRSLVCPHCSKMILLKIKTTEYDGIKHPYFKDKILFSKTLLKLHLQNKITKNDIAEVLGVSEYYVDWLISKWYERPDTEDLKKELDNEPKDN